MDGFLRVDYTNPEHECILFQPDVGVDDNDKTTSSKAQPGARKEFAGLPIVRQQPETASTEQSKQFDPGGRRRIFLLSVENGFHCSLVCPYASYFFLVFFCLILRAGTRGEDNFHSRVRERLGCKPNA